MQVEPFAVLLRHVNPCGRPCAQLEVETPLRQHCLPLRARKRRSAELARTLVTPICLYMRVLTKRFRVLLQRQLICPQAKRL